MAKMNKPYQLLASQAVHVTRINKMFEKGKNCLYGFLRAEGNVLILPDLSDKYVQNP